MPSAKAWDNWPRALGARVHQLDATATYILFPTPAVTGGILNFVVGFGVVALLILVLTRGRLGYR
jgi:hypothetical protein